MRAPQPRYWLTRVRSRWARLRYRVRPDPSAKDADYAKREAELERGT